MAEQAFRPDTGSSDRGPPWDLLIRAGRAVCPDSGWDGPAAVAVRSGRIAAFGAEPAGAATATIDAPDGLLLPGLIDLHAHPARSGSIFGVDPDQFMLPRGVTTVLSQGDAGAENFSEFLRETISGSQTRVLLAMNLSRIGETSSAGCLARPDDADVEACAAAVEISPNHVWGISVNASTNACGPSDPRDMLRRGLAVAERTQRPLLYGMRRPEDWPLEDQLRLLRPGDVVTYCYRRHPHCIVANGRVLPAVREARRRGILFDLGHGMASFDWEVAAAAIADGFPPDTISTDLQRRHVAESVVHDLPTTMSKLRAAGMPEGEVFAAVTSRPARILRRDLRIGTLRPGACADLVLLAWSPIPEVLTDCCGATRKGGRWQPLLTVRAGKVVPTPQGSPT